ncbi:DUF3135 domain-containing protein [Halopseudomonas nanhaiensis]|uniref:DUF3135 domain-containing protein n=1 Tax=Halopseudomonas nanhaiensis TaxID=2830842 RepID=UPI001CBCD5CA|nr:DUF3135 domain-containing protein [Halopseudomonas nanhaiensis]UAW97277.1 DUF3135 domain-containing protein [Halopseudomonas nanhaiensis]
MARPLNALPSFDELKAMAAERPEELESLRKRMTDEILRDAPEDRRRRLEGIVFKINAERRRCKNPLQACIRISQMMMDSVVELREAVNTLGSQPGRQPLHAEAPRTADVVPFRRQAGS